MLDYEKRGDDNLTMNERVKIVRDYKKMNQSDFGEKIKISRSQVAAIENNLRTLTDRVIFDICREFSVNEAWLRTGEGEMFIKSETFSLDEYAEKKGLSPLEYSLIKGYMDIDANTREKLLEHFKVIFAGEKRNLSNDATGSFKEIVNVSFDSACGNESDLSEAKLAKK